MGYDQALSMDESSLACTNLARPVALYPFWPCEPSYLLCVAHTSQTWYQQWLFSYLFPEEQW